AVTVSRVYHAEHPVPARGPRGVRVVGADGAAALRDPVEEHRAQLGPERFTSRSHPVEVDDVLVALGRVLGGLDGAVRPALEPLGVLADVRMVRRALESDVERDLDAKVLRRADEAAEVFEGAELRMDRLV